MSIAQLNQQKLDEINAKRKGKDSVDLLIKNIMDNTERIESNEENFITKKKEFKYDNGKYVNAGILYHIHYTKDLNEYYMTEYEHDNKISKIIYKRFNNTNFKYFNSLNKQAKLKILQTKVQPTSEDYETGSYLRYFAILGNNPNAGGFEVSVDDFEISPLYKFENMNWFISGRLGQVIINNIKELSRVKETIPNIKKIVPVREYYKEDDNLLPKQLVKKKLGIQGTEY